MAQNEEKKFQPVDLATLKTGMLVDRPLYVYLSGNDHYIQLCKPLHPLEQKTLEKFQKIGNAFSTEPSIEMRFPQLAESARAVRDLCDDESLAPFEKNHGIRAITEWLVPHVLQAAGQNAAPLLFFHRAFGVPRAETLVFLSDLSVVIFEKSLSLAAYCGVLALWLGYSDTRFLSQFVETIFCESVGLYRDSAPLTFEAAISDEDRSASLKLMSSGGIPGVTSADQRMHPFMVKSDESQAAGDELYGIVAFARWLLKDIHRSDDVAGRGRVARKLAWQLSYVTESAANTKEAA